MALGFSDFGQTAVTMQLLADALERWPVAVPLQLDFTANDHLQSPAPQWGAVMEALRCPTFAPGGLQVLDFSSSRLGATGAQQLAAAVQASQQMSVLQELRLTGCGIGDEGAIALLPVTTLQASTHMRSLSLLDLSFCFLRQEGVAALAACLCGAPHLAASLRQLGVAANRMGDESMATLASAVASCGVQLTHLDIRHNHFGQEGAKAWAAALRASTHLAGLQVLDLSHSDVGDDGMSALCDSLQAATHARTHLARLQRLALFPAGCGLEGVTRFAQLLLDAPHVAGIQELSLRYAGAWGHPAAAAAAASVVLGAGSPLTQLRSLDLSYCSGKDLQRFCDALPGATHLSGLRDLSLEGWPINEAVCAALAASHHLSGLRQLTLREGCWDVGKLLCVLQVAPHLRNLASMQVECTAATARGALRNVLKLLPRVRRISLLLGEGADEQEAVWDALRHAPCAPSLEELCVMWECEDASSYVAHIAVALQCCVCLPGLRRLQLHNDYYMYSGLEGLAGALAAAPHLPSLRELQVDADDALTQHVYDVLAASKLAGARVVFMGIDL